MIDRLNAALEERYQIDRGVGEGGTATVFLADDLRHERKVALKVLKPELAAVVGAERFLAEIKTTANLQHPHILPLFDSGEADSCADRFPSRVKLPRFSIAENVEPRPPGYSSEAGMKALAVGVAIVGTLLVVPPPSDDISRYHRVPDQDLVRRAAPSRAISREPRLPPDASQETLTARSHLATRRPIRT